MDNRKFWNERYQSLPALGSGPGSRAYAAWLKRRLIESIVAERNIRSILDIGCGDMYWMPADSLAGVAYTGVDISDLIVQQNRLRFPDAEFLLHDIAAAPLPRGADLVICFDVLIHQIDEAQFSAALRNILATIEDTALISYLTPAGHTQVVAGDTPEAVMQEEQKLLEFLSAASFPRAQTATHGELAQLISRMRPNLDVTIAGSYPAQTIYAVALRA